MTIDDGHKTTYCEYCGDRLEDGRHTVVSKCVPLCEKCGGLKEDDDRWSTDQDERCDCPEMLR